MEKTCCFPTHIEINGELLKICLQQDHKLATFVEEYILKNLNELRSVKFVPKKEELYPGLICIGQFDDQQYYRIKVLDHIYQKQIVNALFIDYGNMASLPLTNVRLLSFHHSNLLNIPPLAVTCFLEGVQVHKKWTLDELSTLKKFILYEERQCIIRRLSDDINVVNIFIANTNKFLNKTILQNDLGTYISDSKLILLAKGMMPSSMHYSERSDSNRPKSHQQRPIETQQAYAHIVPKYTAENSNYETDRIPSTDSDISMQMLKVGSTHHVYVSHMEDGPYSFFIQLKTNAEDALPRLANLLKQHKLLTHTPPLMPGCMVLTHVQADNSYRRSIVMSIKNDFCMVYHMDYGNTEEISCNKIYQIPLHSKSCSAMALRFRLADIKEQQISDSAKAYIQEFLEKKCVLIRVVSEENGNPLYQYCEMFYDNKNVKEILSTFNSPLEYTSQPHPRGKDIKVTVSYVDSPAQFCIQYSSKLEIIRNIQVAVNAHCASQERLKDMSSVSIGSPVAAYFEDNIWYRAMVVGINPNSVKVLYVDYGNRCNVALKHLCPISRELVTKWRTQAVECCLVGFENCSDITEEVTEVMLNKTLGNTFNLKLLSILNSSRLLVDLIDNLGEKVSKEIQGKKQSSSPDVTSRYVKSREPQSTIPQFESFSNLSPGDLRNKIKGGVGLTAKSPPPRQNFNRSGLEPSYKEHDNRDVDLRNKTRGDGGKSFPKENFSRTGLESTYNEHDDRGLDTNVPRGYNKHFEENRRKNRHSDEKSVGSRGSDDFNDDNARKVYNTGSRFRRNDDNSFEQSGGDRRKGSGFNRPPRDDNTVSESTTDERPRRPYNARPRPEDESGKRFSVRDRFNNRSDNRDSIDNTNDRRGGKFGDDPEKRPERKGQRFGSDDGERRGTKFSGGNNERRGPPRGGYDSNERHNSRSSGGNNKFGGDEDGNWRGEGRRTGGGGGPRRGGDWNREEGGGGGTKRSFDSDTRKKWNDNSSSKGFNNTSDTYDPGSKDMESWNNDDIVAPPPTPLSSSSVGGFPLTNVIVDTQLKVHLSMLGNPHSFYVQFEDSLDKLNELRQIIETEIPSLTPVKDISSLPLGTPVLARFSSDLLLYRGLIQQIVPPSAAIVLFVDYGNCDFVQAEDIFMVTQSLSHQPPVAVHCSLLGVKPVGEEWDQDGNLYIEAFQYEEALTMTVVSAKMLDGQLVVNVNLTNPSGVDVSQVLANTGHAICTKPLVETSPVDSSAQMLESTPAPVPQTNEEFPVPIPQTNETFPVPIPKSTEPFPAPIPESSELLPVPEIVYENMKMPVLDKWVDRLDLLVGQKLYCTVLEVLQENLFVVSFDQAKVITLVTISVDQLHNALVPQTKIIVEVKAVLDDRLRVITYDLNGLQMGTMGGTNPLKVNPICSFPVIRRSDHVIVTHSDGAVVYLQRASDANRLQDLLDMMYTFYEKTQPDPEVTWKIGDTCAAHSPTDSNWYRAKLVNSPKEFTVKYIDYGNTEEVFKGNLRKLDDRFIFSELCLNVVLPVYWRMPDPPLLEVVNGEEMYAKFTRDQNGKWIADLSFMNGEKLINKLTEKNIASIKTDSPFEEENIIVGSDLIAGNSVQIVVSHEDSLTKFWVHLVKHVNKINELQDRLQNMIENLNEGKANELIVFAAQYLEDNVWYRATKVGDELLRFIDYGNTDSITGQVKQLPIDLMKPFSGYSVPMHLCVKPILQDWPEEAVVMQQAFIENPSLTAEIINVDYKIVVDLKADGKLLSEVLIEGGFAVYHDYISESTKKFLLNKIPDVTSCDDISSVIKLGSKEVINKQVPSIDSVPEVSSIILVPEVSQPINIGEGERVFVIHCTSPNDFYIQEESKADILDEIENTLLTVELVPHTGQVKVGEMFAVQFDEDNLWYRSVVLSTEPPVQVKFIDYGTTVTTADLRVLPESTISHPPLAIHCSFDVEETPQLVSSFSTISNLGQVPLRVRFKSFGSPNVVSLLTEDGEDVLQILLDNSEGGNTLVKKLPKIPNFPEEFIDDEHILENDKIEVPVQLPKQESEGDVKQCYISSICSITEFYIQDIDMLPVLTEIRDKFSCEEISMLDDFNIGDYVAAKFEDGSWNRCLVIETGPDIIVQFLDFGNEGVVDKVYRMPENIQNLPSVVIQCSLSIHNRVLIPNSFDKFVEIFNDGSTLFTYNILSKNGDTNIIDLFLDNKNLLSELTTDIQCTKENKKAGVDDEPMSRTENISLPVITKSVEESNIKVDDVTKNINADDSNEVNIGATLIKTTTEEHSKDIPLPSKAQQNGDISIEEKEDKCAEDISEVLDKMSIEEIVTKSGSQLSEVGTDECSDAKSNDSENIGDENKEAPESGNSEGSLVDESLCESLDSIKIENDSSQKNVSKTNNIVVVESIPKIRASKPVKTLAEIRASAKSRIVTRTPKSVGSKPVTNSNNTKPEIKEILSCTLEVSIQNKDDVPVAGSPTPTNMPQGKQSKADEIVPGSITGNIVDDTHHQ